MKINLCSSLLLPQAFLWLVLSCYCTGFLRCQGRKNKARRFHPGVLDSCLWGWHGAILLLSTSSLELLPMEGAGSHLAGAPSDLYRVLVCSHKTKRGFFLHFVMEMKNRLHLRKKHGFLPPFSALEIKCGWWVLQPGWPTWEHLVLVWTCHAAAKDLIKSATIAFLFVSFQKSPSLSFSLPVSFFLFFSSFFLIFFPPNYTGNVLEGRVKRLKSGIFMYTRNLNVWLKLINSPHLFLFSL